MSHMADQFGTLQNSSCKDFMQKFFFNYYNCIIEARRFFFVVSGANQIKLF